MGLFQAGLILRKLIRVKLTYDLCSFQYNLYFSSSPLHTTLYWGYHSVEVFTQVQERFAHRKILPWFQQKNVINSTFAHKENQPCWIVMLEKTSIQISLCVMQITNVSMSLNQRLRSLRQQQRQQQQHLLPLPPSQLLRRLLKDSWPFYCLWSSVHPKESLIAFMARTVDFSTTVEMVSSDYSRVQLFGDSTCLLGNVCSPTKQRATPVRNFSMTEMWNMTQREMCLSSFFQ